MNGARILTAGEQGLVIEFGSAIDYEVNMRVHQAAALLQEKLGDCLLEAVPTYRSLLVYFNPLKITRLQLMQQIEEILSAAQAAIAAAAATVVHIPVCYGGEYGPDLEFVASHNNLSVKEVIDIHTSTPYLVYMLGFTPGFPYLGGMSERIATPRLTQPRTKIPAGSVGIAGSQTGLYPIESPGGWQLIGRTPIKAFDPHQDNPFLFAAGNYLQFTAVTAEEYRSIAEQVAKGSYVPQTSSLRGGGN